MTEPIEERQAPRPGDEITLDVDKLAFGGSGLGRVDGFVVFVDRALPGQRVRARVVRAKKRHAEAQLMEVVTPSAHQVQPPCPHFGTCGGCLWQDLDYAEQLKWKQVHVRESLARLAGAEDTPVAETTASPLEYGYRNKLEFDFGGGVLSGSAGAGSMNLGFHRRGASDIVNVTTCLLQSETSARLVNAVREWTACSGAPAYDPRSRNGFWRRMVVRRSSATGQMLVQFVTAPGKHHAKAVSSLAERILAEFGPGDGGEGVVGVSHALRRTAEPEPAGDKVVGVFGSETMEERIGDLVFQVSAGAFFQPNTGGAEQLYRTVSDLAGLTGSESVWDLYCGSGGISLSLAPKAQSVTGFDIGRDSIRDAKANAAANGLTNCAFASGDVKAVLGRERQAPDLLVADPPRAGLHPDAVGLINKLGPARIVYVSCNPPTQARDLAGLLDAYQLVEARPVDLFPHSPHIECVALLTRK